MVETIGFPVTANQSSAGDYLPIDSDTLAGCTVTNSSAYAVEYSTGGAWTTIAAGGSATINTGAIATTSLRFRKKTGDSTPVVLSVAVTHPGTIPAHLATDAGGNPTSLTLGAQRVGLTDLAHPPVDSVLSKYGKTAYDITLGTATPASATSMTWSRSSEKCRFATETIKIQPSADTGSQIYWNNIGMTCDPDDLLYTVDVWVDTLAPTYPTNTPIITITVSNNAALGSNYDQWTFDNANMRQGWNTFKLWSGDDLTGGYRDSNMPQGATRAKTGTGFDFTQPCQYFAIRFSYMNGYTVYVDQIRRGAKAKPKLVIGMDATGASSGDTAFINGLAPLFKRFSVPSYFTYTWVYDALYSATASWDRAVALYRDWGWDAINHSWNHGATVEGRRNTVSISAVSDAATITFSAAHSIPIGKRFKAKISGASPAAFNSTFWMQSTTTTQATYTATGAGTASATGTIYLTTLLSEIWNAYSAEDQRLLDHEIADVSSLMKASGMGRGAHLMAWPNNSVPDLTMVQASCDKAGVRFARGGRQGNCNINEFGIDNPLHIGSWPFESSASLYTTQTTLKKKILGAIGRGDCIFLFGHFILDETDPANVAHASANLEYPPGQGGNPAPPAVGAVNADGGWWYLGQMRQLLEWLQAYRSSGQIEVLGFRDFAQLNGYGMGK